VRGEANESVDLACRPFNLVMAVGPGESTGAAPPSSERRAKKIRTVLLVAVIVIAAAVSGAVWFYLSDLPRTGVSNLSVYNESRVLPGTLGCRGVEGEVCFSLMVVTQFQGLQLSDVHFKLTNLSSQDQNGPPVPVGPSAGVSVLDTATTVAGHFNWSAGAWTNGSTWSVPTGIGVELVFDSGLLSASSLNNTNFWVVLSSPGSGAAGAILHTS
jgi:hypothetical protein